MSEYLSRDYDSETLWRLRLEEAEAYETAWQEADAATQTKGTSMKVSEAFPSKYLKAADLKGRAHLVKISEVVQETVGQNKELKLVAYFAGKEKGMVLNQTNANTIGAKFGDDTADWGGAEVELYPDMVNFQNQMVPALRIRIPVPAATADEEIPF